MSVCVIIVAAGRGERFGGATPKQLMDLGGKTVLQRSVAAFDAHAGIASIVVVLPEALVESGPALVGATARPCIVVAGGARRQDSVRLGFEAVPQAATIVLVHDAARPMADQALIDRVVAGALRTGASVPAVAARDTVKRVAKATTVVAETIPRDEIWLAQTPQGFRRDILQAAVALGLSGVEATDEATLAERAGHPVEVVAGDERNIKITTEDDLASAWRLWAPGPRIGTGYDLHRLVDGRPLVLAGVEVDRDRGPLGHSDGDVACHALVDAMFGAAAAGDIGRHFPNTDPRWKDAPGLDLLARAAAIIAERGWRVSSVDVTVVLERPKLAPHIDPIRARIAATLGVGVDGVGLKAKTNEGVDAIGRGEAIAAQAVAVLVKGARL